MKRFFALALSLAAIILLGSCDKESGQTSSATITFEGSEFISATKPYSADATPEDYAWQDKATTLSCKPIFVDSYGYKLYCGGLTISSYNSKDIERFGSYEYDLYAYNPSNADSKKGGGHNGSDNFAIFCQIEIDPTIDTSPVLAFADGKPRTIKGCYVNSTTYFLNVAENGNAFSPALGQDDKIILRATGYDRSDKKTSTTELEFARKGSMTKGWKAWDLSPLGEVVKVRFEILGGPSDEWGMKTPKYFAIDDIMVEWKE